MQKEKLMTVLHHLLGQASLAVYRGPALSGRLGCSLLDTAGIDRSCTMKDALLLLAWQVLRSGVRVLGEGKFYLKPYAQYCIVLISQTACSVDQFDWFFAP